MPGHGSVVAGIEVDWMSWNDSSNDVDEAAILWSTTLVAITCAIYHDVSTSRARADTRVAPRANTMRRLCTSADSSGNGRMVPQMLKCYPGCSNPSPDAVILARSQNFCEAAVGILHDGLSNLQLCVARRSSSHKTACEVKHMRHVGVQQETRLALFKPGPTRTLRL